ncbi:GNAT family N-acetyltransferase [Flavobacterium agricola]|uniref:GNAT family N-acetyltransferase n=1 Tax=Flavobacterium agricola TaxID=2870839 RepID=A0ABY6LVB3_9FLAO|nr:GNAT family N-acetyltransferase [Flavobacterium agricola]UYW00288.1 GNAT family N-acetyltransferase [Flavobacterium agricola]
MDVKIMVAQPEHYCFAQEIVDTIEASAKVRGTGIAKRTPEYIQKKIDQQQAIIALTKSGQFAGFCYIETWSHGKYVAHSGLIVHPDFRKDGLAKEIKTFTFDYSRKLFPEAKIFGITTGLAVMKINSDLGYHPVPFSELTDDPAFWAGCKTCVNFDILTRKENKMCLCTGMLFDPAKQRKQIKNGEPVAPNYTFNKKVLERLKNIKKALFLKK